MSYIRFHDDAGSHLLAPLRYLGLDNYAALSCSVDGKTAGEPWSPRAAEPRPLCSGQCQPGLRRSGYKSRGLHGRHLSVSALMTFPRSMWARPAHTSQSQAPFCVGGAVSGTGRPSGSQGLRTALLFVMPLVQRLGTSSSQHSGTRLVRQLLNTSLGCGVSWWKGTAVTVVMLTL